MCADVTKTEVATPPTRAFTSHEPAEPSREKTLRVCYFGAYDREYVRNVVLINGLRRNGVEVVECHDAHAVKPWRLPRLVAKYARLARHVDAIVVGACGHAYVPLARLLASVTGKPLIFDSFLSQYDTAIEDRRTASPRSLHARYYRGLDRVAVACSDVVLLDTPQYIDYFSEHYRAPRSKYRALPIGADDENFYPSPLPQGENFRVLFVGTFIPLHGLEYVLQAAALLKDHRDIEFTIVGAGQTFPEMRRLADDLQLQNTHFVGEQAPARCAQSVRESDVCLGIFGRGEKTARVIPCKVYEALSSARPVVTGDTPAARELLVDGESAMLCPVGDAAALAKAVLSLKSDVALRQRIAQNGSRVFLQKATPAVLGLQLKAIISAAVASRRHGKA